MAISSTLFSSRSEEWGTPPDLFAKLDAEFHFTLDACATARNTKCRRFFDKRIDGLKQNWSGERVFLNPPYGRQIGEWMKKARTEAARGALVVCLVHARTDTRWWHENVEGYADEVCFLRGRLRFEPPVGVPSFTAPFPSAIIVYRPRKLLSEGAHTSSSFEQPTEGDSSPLPYWTSHLSSILTIPMRRNLSEDRSHIRSPARPCSMMIPTTRVTLFPRPAADNLVEVSL